jgi:peptidylprolyl isomerase
VNVNYFGWTSDGKIFDSTNQNGTTTPTDISLSGVIKGWTQGLTGVKVGSTVKLTIPAALGYAEAGSPPNIGPNEPLQFIIEIKELKK